MIRVFSFVFLVLSYGSHAAELSDFIRAQSGKPIWVNYSLAEKACKDLGMRLPVAREVAEYAIGRGTDVIQETKFPYRSINSPEVQSELLMMEREGFRPNIIKSASRRHVVSFYYSSDRYQYIPDGESNRLSVWTSTPLPKYRGHYVFHGSSGVLGIASNKDNNSVRCLISP
jgi:hypothetical protein